MLPEFAFFDIGRAKLPVLVRLVDAGKEALALFILRKMEEELDDTSPVGVEMSFEIRDRTMTVVPKGLIVLRRVGESSARRSSRCTRTISTSS
jgi:hypothetical protein